jgi:hypothetical protein
MGVQAGPAAAAVLIFRAVTLLLGTILGWAALLIYRRRFHVQPSLSGMVSAVQRSEHEAEAAVEPVRPERDPAVAPLKEG